MGVREDLLEAAKKCLVSRGWGSTTVRDIAAAAGTSHTAVSYYFGSRDALMSDALIEAVGDLGREIGTAGPTMEDKRAHWQALFASINTHRQLWLAQLEAVRQAQHTPALRQRLRIAQRKAQEDLGGPLMQAVLLGVVVQSLVDPSTATSTDQVLNVLAGAGREDLLGQTVDPA